MNTRPNTKAKFARVVLGVPSNYSVSVPAFTGSGTNDLELQWDHISTIPAGGDVSVKIEIDGNGTPDTYKISFDGGSSWEYETQNCTTDGSVTMPYGIQPKFNASTGHTIGDYWTFTIYQYARDYAHDFSHSDDALTSELYRKTFVRDFEATLPDFQPTGVNMDANAQTGSDFPKRVNRTGTRTNISLSHAKPDLDLLTVWSFLVAGSYTVNGGVLAITPDMSRRIMPVSDIGYRYGRNQGYARLYGMAPRSMNISIPTDEGGYVGFSSEVVGSGKYDMSPWGWQTVAVETAATATSLTLPTALASLGEGTTVQKYLRAIHKIMFVDSSGNKWFTTATDAASSTAISVTPVSIEGASGSGTWYVSMIDATTHAGWPTNIDGAVDP